MNITNSLLETVKKLPDHSAIVFKGKQVISYAQLGEQVLKVAGGLQEIGIRKHTHVAIMMTNRPEYIVTYYALLAIGATVVPLNPLFKENEVKYVLNDSDSEAVIFDDHAANVIQAAKGDLEKVKTFIHLGKEQVGNTISWECLSESKKLDKPVEMEDEDLAQIIYTSGTTGKPKGAMITQKNVDWMSQASLSLGSLTSEDKLLLVLPLYHAYAKLQGMVSPLRIGATIYLEERFIPDEMLKRISEKKITEFMGVPTMYTMFVNSPKIREYDFSALKYCGSGGASIPAEIKEKVAELMGVDVQEGYGQTESTVMISRTRPEGKNKHGSVGLPVPGVDLKIVDVEGNELPAGEIGEIIFRGPNAMKGYYKKPEETANTIKDGWVHTGDLGYVDEAGYIFIVDRKKDMIIRGGYNVYPREIEEVLYTHPQVVECAVVGEPDPVFGEEVAAFIVTRTEIPKEDIINFCKEQLVHYKVPRKIYFTDELPKTSTGKILKAKVKELLKN